MEHFVQLVLDEVIRLEIEDITTIQSFDFESLRLTKKRLPEIQIAMLIMNRIPPEENVRNLGFKPDIYSSYFALVNEELMAYCREEGIKVIPWTVNKKEDIQRMLDLDVDGIISDYPDLVLEML